MLFFQAEDGIRDLVRSRGLGDVYKRQPLPLLSISIYYVSDLMNKKSEEVQRQQSRLSTFAVSYTHLTLPTSDLV